MVILAEQEIRVFGNIRIGVSAKNEGIRSIIFQWPMESFNTIDFHKSSYSFCRINRDVNEITLSSRSCNIIYENWTKKCHIFIIIWREHLSFLLDDYPIEVIWFNI